VTDFTGVQQAVPGSTRSVEVALTNCPANSTITLQLNGEQDPSGNGRLKINSGPNMATGIAIATSIGDSWKNVGSTAQISADASGRATFRVGGTLVKRAANIPVTPGQVEASMTMTLTFN
jgi:type 1 fimbria pilin